MEESEGVNCFSESRSSSESRPPNPNPNPSIASAYRQCQRSDPAVLHCRKSLVRHASLTTIKLSEVCSEPGNVTEDCQSDFLPKLRSGGCADMGFRSSMEDVYVCVDNFMQDQLLKSHIDGPSAFYGVFDGHGGKHAADFACHHLPKFILEDEGFPRDIERIIASAFMQTDNAFAEACSLDAALASGTTALATLVIGRLLVVANAGDCRAVLCRRGKAIEMSRDHKPICSKEKKRIEGSGGYVYDGYLNGQLNVARAIGDWHMEGMKSKDGGPLSAEPELMTTKLTAEDEFLIIGCDGIWDVFRSQNAVDFARRRLQEHNDPALCSKDLIDEALKRKSGDNLSAVVVCFHQQPPPNLVAPRSRVHRSFSAEGLKELQSFLDSLGN
ncbi:probable protein phosphatase 2C 22 isoform X2 [Lotus japonicus]|uniref:probable protein phosphatase 2C 22 isoform X2 n=1 Tax=Lotus japonicus TaxID=34305 RepID=UPI00258AEA70|nr:probable protein phosphatase 2C 22 isoform X2 [Lotus japonicus]